MAGKVGFCCPIVAQLRDGAFELRHRCLCIGGCRLDVIRIRRGHVSVTQNCLDRFLGDAEPIQVGSQASARRVPAVPLGKRFVAHELVFGPEMLDFAYAANHAAI